MDTSYTAVEYFLSFFGSWRDGQDPAVLSLATRAPAPTSDAPIHSSEQNKLRGRSSMGSEANMDFRRSYAVCLFRGFFKVRTLYESESQTVVNEHCAIWAYRLNAT